MEICGVTANGVTHEQVTTLEREVASLQMHTKGAEANLGLDNVPLVRDFIGWAPRSATASVATGRRGQPHARPAKTVEALLAA